MKVGVAVGLIERGGCGGRTSRFEVVVEASSGRVIESSRFASNRERKKREEERGEGKREGG